ncbi:MAG: hypothetical protein ACFFDX_02905 [Candidatus Odinarchaeota archaeon]
MFFISELDLAQLSGFTALLSVCIGFFFGFIVLIKSIKVKDLLVFNFFLCIIFTLSPWYPSGLGYVYWLINNKPLDYEIYVLVGIVCIPIAILAWLNVYMTTVKPKKKKIILSLYAIFSIAFEIYLFYFLFFAPGAPVESLLGIKDPYNPMDIDYKGFVLVYLGASILTACITGIHFAIKSIKEKETPHLLWKGRFLLAAFILFGISAVFDAIVQMDQVLLIIMRIILVMSNLFFYIGFILPKWVEKILPIRESES